MAFIAVTSCLFHLLDVRQTLSMNVNEALERTSLLWSNVSRGVCRHLCGVPFLAFLTHQTVLVWWLLSRLTHPFKREQMMIHHQ